MDKLTTKARLYVVGTIIAGTALFLWNIIYIDISNIWMTLALVVLASVALIFKVEGTTNRSHYNISFLIYSATFFLLGAPAAMLVILISNLVEWGWHKYPWYIQSFNIGCYLITMQATSLVFTRANPDKILFSWLGVITMLVAMVVFTGINHTMVGIILWLARGENFKQSGVFDSLPLMIDFTLLSMGAGLALVWTLDPIAIIFMLIPLYLIYSTLRVPSLERQTEIDPKTGVFNHKYFESKLENELSRAHRFDRPLSVVMADLDLLRNINNTYGHLAGDEVLIGVAGILNNHARDFDVVARYGGEEFSLLLPETTSEEAFEIVERIRVDIESAEFAVPTSVAPIRATMSFGIAGRDNDTLTPKEILHNADIAVYHSKLRGRNRTFYYTDQTYQGLFHISSSALQEDDREIEKMSVPQSEIHNATIKIPANHAIPRLVTNSNKNEPPASQAKPNWLVNIFILATAIISVGLYLLFYNPLAPGDIPGTLLFMGLVFLTEWFSIDIYFRNTAVSTSAAPMLAGYLLFGASGAFLLSFSFAVAAFIRHKSPVSRMVFNFSNQLLGAMLCLGFIQMIGIDFSGRNHMIQLIVCLISAIILYIFTTGLVALAIHLSTGEQLRKTWQEQFGWLAPHYAVMGMIAYTLVFSFDHAGLIGTVVVAVPLLILRLSQKQYLDRTKDMVTELREKNVILEKSSEEISTLNEGLLKTLAEVVDLRDPYVLGHSQQVMQYAVLLSQTLGLEDVRIDLIRQASLLHDIGKLGVPERILLKPSKLTTEEYEIVKEHATLGADILEASRSLRELIPIVRHHHERFDGNGYPDGLKAEAIPIEARIVSVADAIEAMASDRPYRQAMQIDQILDELKRNSGTQFDPVIVCAFEEIASTNGALLVVNSARQEVNLRLHNELDDIYHNLLQNKLEEKMGERLKTEETNLLVHHGSSLSFSFVTLPGK